MHIAALKVKSLIVVLSVSIFAKRDGLRNSWLLDTCQCFHQDFPKQNKRRRGAGIRIYNRNEDDAQPNIFQKWGVYEKK